MRHHESKLQQECVKWFRYSYARYKLLLFAIPNGGGRSYADARILNGEGVVPGVADLFLSVPKREFHGLYIEMKYGKNKMSIEQLEFKAAVEKHGYKHVCCWSADEFMREATFYLS